MVTFRNCDDDDGDATRSLSGNVDEALAQSDAEPDDATDKSETRRCCNDDGALRH